MSDHRNRNQASQHAATTQLARPRPPERKDCQAPHRAVARRRGNAGPPLWWALTLSILGFAIVHLWRSGKVDPNPFDDVAFVGEVWKREAGLERERSERGPMAEAAQRLLLSGPMNRDDVLRVLGGPDEYSTERVLRYWLGFWSGFRWDPDVLEVEFDRAGVVSRVSIVQT